MRKNINAENKVNFVDSKRIHIEKLKNNIKELYGFFIIIFKLIESKMKKIFLRKELFFIFY